MALWNQFPKSSCHHWMVCHCCLSCHVHGSWFDSTRLVQSIVLPFIGPALCFFRLCSSFLSGSIFAWTSCFVLPPSRPHDLTTSRPHDLTTSRPPDSSRPPGSSLPSAFLSCVRFNCGCDHSPVGCPSPLITVIYRSSCLSRRHHWSCQLCP